MSTALRIDMVSDVVCPWCAIGLARLEQAAAELEDIRLELHWHPFLLNPDIPAEGRDMTEHLGAKYGRSPAEVAESQIQLIDTATELGLNFEHALERRSWNTLITHCVLHHAREQGKDDALNRALFEAYFGRAENPTDRDVLMRCGTAVGLDPAVIGQIVDEAVHAEAVREEVEQYRALGISAVPSFIVESKYLISGAQPPDALADGLRRIARESGGEPEAMAPGSSPA